MSRAMRVAIEGCGHGTLNAIYAAVQTACEKRNWDGVDLLIIGGDFQATRNAADLSVMSVPAKYREMGDFHEYYSGARKAPYLTIFVGGNHEAASHLWELYYGGWVAPNIYYMGAANVLRLGPLRIAGMSGIWKGYNYRKAHHERLPFGEDDIKSFYHVRELDVRKLLQIREQADVGISHDWPRLVERHGDEKALWRMKPDFEQESYDGQLGNPAAGYVMDRLRPPHWFSAHMHCKFAALKKYDPPKQVEASEPSKESEAMPAQPTRQSDVSSVQTFQTAQHAANPDEIDLDMDDDGDANQIAAEKAAATEVSIRGGDKSNTNEIDLDMDDDKYKESTVKRKETKDKPTATSVVEGVSNEVLAELPAAFARPPPQRQHGQPGQPTPPTITNTEVRFLALDKCLPGRKFLQVMEIEPISAAPSSTSAPANPPHRLEYDPEWLAITRVFASETVIGQGRDAATPPHDKGHAHYVMEIDRERKWVEENIVQKGKLAVPENFAITAPPHVPGQPESTRDQPDEYTNPQTVAFCELVGVENLWDASEAERLERKQAGPPPSERRGGFRGGGRGFGGRGGGRGSGRGGGRGGHGRGWGRGRGRG